MLRQVMTRKATREMSTENECLFSYLTCFLMLQFCGDDLCFSFPNCRLLLVLVALDSICYFTQRETVMFVVWFTTVMTSMWPLL